MSLSWIEQAKNTQDPSQLGELIHGLRTSNANLVTEYGAAQGAAGVFLKQEQEIPSGLVAAIRFTGGRAKFVYGIIGASSLCRNNAAEKELGVCTLCVPGSNVFHPGLLHSARYTRERSMLLCLS